MSSSRINPYEAPQSLPGTFAQQLSDPSGRIQIVIKRTTSYADRIRAYKVFVDGINVGKVSALESVAISLAPGHHRLDLRIDWCGSPILEFDLQPGHQATFECGSSLTVWRLFLGFFYIIFWPRNYLWLRHKN